MDSEVAKSLSERLELVEEQTSFLGEQRQRDLVFVQERTAALEQRLEAILQCSNSHLSPGLLTAEPIIPGPDAQDASELSRHHTITESDLMAETLETYVFHESSWDIATLIGADTLGPCGSLLTSALLIATVVMQTVFTGIVWFNFAVMALQRRARSPVL